MFSLTGDIFFYILLNPMDPYIVMTVVSIVNDGLVVKEVVCIYQELLYTPPECEFFTSCVTCTLLE